MTLDKQSARFCHATSSASSTLFWFHSFALPSHSFSNGPVPKLQSLSQGAGDRVSGFLGGAAKSYAGTYKDEDHTEVPMCSTGRIGSLLMLIDGNPMTSCIVCIVCTDLLQFGSHESELLWAQLKFSFTNSLSFDSLSVRVGENEALVPYY